MTSSDLWIIAACVAVLAGTGMVLRAVALWLDQRDELGSVEQFQQLRDDLGRATW